MTSENFNEFNEISKDFTDLRRLQSRSLSCFRLGRILLF